MSMLACVEDLFQCFEASVHAKTTGPREFEHITVVEDECVTKYTKEPLLANSRLG